MPWDRPVVPFYLVVVLIAIFPRLCALALMNSGDAETSRSVFPLTDARSRYITRCAAVCARHPVEGLDRILGRLERRRFGARRVAYEAAQDWERRFHEMLDAPWPCIESEHFTDLWNGLSSVSDDRTLGSGHDADRALARSVWCFTRHLAPCIVVETGVARGVTSRIVLEALSANGHGHLWSIDLPPLLAGWHGQSAVFVHASLQSRWTYVRGSSRRRLPRLLRELGAIDLAIHDSSLTEPTVRRELGASWSHLRPGGGLIAGGINHSHTFREMTSDFSECVVGRPEGKEVLFGLALKPPETTFARELS